MPRPAPMPRLTGGRAASSQRRPPELRARQPGLRPPGWLRGSLSGAGGLVGGSQGSKARYLRYPTYQPDTNAGGHVLRLLFLRAMAHPRSLLS